MNKVIIIPMDDRTCTYNFPKQFCSMYGYKALMPDRKDMGNLLKEANINSIYKLIENEAKESKALIIASDTLAYGGLITSRRTSISFEQIIKNLEVLKKAKEINPELKIYVCSSIMRISNNNENQEEKEYWSQYGKLIFQYSYLSHKNNLINKENYNEDNLSILSNLDDASINEIRKQIPQNILEDYIKDRLRNFEVNKYLISLLESNIIEHLLICADDSSDAGLNVLEKNILNSYSNKFSENLVVYPGTDEAVSLLVGKFVNQSSNFKPKFYPLYSFDNSCDTTITMYEGVTVNETLVNQVKAVGGSLASSENEADIILFFHLQKEKQVDHYLNAIYNIETPKTPVNLIESNISKINELINSGKKLALIDSAYANGADHDFIANLVQKIDVTNLISFSSWNTTGNSIGTALTQSCIKFLLENKKDIELEKMHYEYLIERFCDDWIYQGFDRLEYIKQNGFPNEISQLEKLKELVNEDCDKFISTLKTKVKEKCNSENISISDIHFPWNRPFEIEIKVNIK